MSDFNKVLQGLAFPGFVNGLVGSLNPNTKPETIEALKAAAPAIFAAGVRYLQNEIGASECIREALAALASVEALEGELTAEHLTKLANLVLGFAAKCERFADAIEDAAKERA